MSSLIRSFPSIFLHLILIYFFPYSIFTIGTLHACLAFACITWKDNCRQILYQLSHKVSPSTLEWVAYPFSRGSSGPRNRTRVSCIAGRFFTNWVSGKPFWVAWWNLVLSCSIPPGSWIVPLSRASCRLGYYVSGCSPHFAPDKT